MHIDFQSPGPGSSQVHKIKSGSKNSIYFNYLVVRVSDPFMYLYLDGEGKVNEEGVQYYNNLIDYLIKEGNDSNMEILHSTILQHIMSLSECFFQNWAGLTPYVNLNHYDIPLALQKKYKGWLGPKIV